MIPCTNAQQGTSATVYFRTCIFMSWGSIVYKITYCDSNGVEHNEESIPGIKSHDLAKVSMKY